MSKNFYNSETLESISYLEFGSIDLQESEKRVWDLRLHQEAYDFFMLARYMKDLMYFRSLTAEAMSTQIEDLIEQSGQNVHTKDLYNAFSKLASLSAVSAQHTKSTENPSFLELGSTLMGCIDSMRFLQALLQRQDCKEPSCNLASVNFHGVDISRLLNDTAKAIHADYCLSTYESLEHTPQSFDVFFAKGVSLLYAISSPEELFSLLATAQISCFDYSLALGREQTVKLGTGKTVVYISLDTFLKSLDSFPTLEILIHQPSASYGGKAQRLTACFYVGSDKQLLQDTVAKELAFKNALVAQASPAARHMFFKEEVSWDASQYVPLRRYLQSLSET